MQIAYNFMEIKRKINQEQEKNEKKIMSERVCSSAAWTASLLWHKTPWAAAELRLAPLLCSESCSACRGTPADSHGATLIYSKG